MVDCGKSDLRSDQQIKATENCQRLTRVGLAGYSGLPDFGELGSLNEILAFDGDDRQPGDGFDSMHE